MGIIANVFRTGVLTPIGTMSVRDCTLHGWSSRFDQVCVVNADGPFDPSDECPAVVIVRHRTCHSLHAVLQDHVTAKKWTMMGGNFLHCTDSRFGELCRKLLEEQPRGLDFKGIHFGYGAVAIHDRIEG